MQYLSEWGRHASRSWIFWSSAGAVIVVTTHILSRAVVRKLPPGTDSEANSLTAREPMGLMLAKERGSFGMRPHRGCREDQPSMHTYL